MANFTVDLCVVDSIGGTYDNGASGVGATITGFVDGALIVDGVAATGECQS